MHASIAGLLRLGWDIVTGASMVNPRLCGRRWMVSKGSVVCWLWAAPTDRRVSSTPQCSDQVRTYSLLAAIALLVELSDVCY